MKRPRNRNNRASNPRYACHNEQNATKHTDQPAAHHQIERAVRKPPAGNTETEEQEHRAHERGFWERQIRVANRLNWITAGGAIVALVGLGFVYWSIISADNATTEANRAWVGIYRADHGPLNITKPMHIQLTLVNTGREPALRGNWGIKIHSVNHIPETNGNFVADLASFRNEACDRVHIFPSGEGTSIWPTLFHTPDPGNPNDPQLGPAEIPYASEIGEQGDIDLALTRNKSLILDACFVYWSGNQRRQTSARFLLRDSDGVAPSGWDFNQIPSGNSAD